MKIQYHSAGVDSKVITIEIQDKDILSWRMSNELGYPPNGSLIVDYLNNEGRGVESIYPPCDSIIGLDETIKYLKEVLGKKYNLAKQ